MRAERVLTVLALLLLAVPSGAASGQSQGLLTAEIEAVHSRLVAELMSPFCQGLTLENCPTSGAAQMREQILAWLVEGRSEEWVVDTLVEEWGETILGAPRFRGVGIVAWLAPGVVLIAAGAALLLWLRGSTAAAGAVGRDVPTAPIAPAEGEDLRRRVEEEVAALID